MKGLYPDESQKQDVFGHLEEMRRRILVCLGLLALAAVLLFARGGGLLALAMRPLEACGPSARLIFIGPAEGFTSYVMMVLLAAFAVTFPVMLYELWAFLAPAASRAVQRRMLAWMFSSLLLFAAGSVFSYAVALPAALGFLLGFASAIAEPQITLGKYVSFFTAFMLIGGTVFQIPVLAGLFADLGLVRSRSLKEKRHYAVVGMLLLAAFMTPTQDIVNMAVFALPMILLYEVGIVIVVWIERNRKNQTTEETAEALP